MGTPYCHCLEQGASLLDARHEQPAAHLRRSCLSAFGTSWSLKMSLCSFLTSSCKSCIRVCLHLGPFALLIAAFYNLLSSTNAQLQEIVHACLYREGLQVQQPKHGQWMHGRAQKDWLACRGRPCSCVHQILRASPCCSCSASALRLRLCCSGSSHSAHHCAPSSLN